MIQTSKNKNVIHFGVSEDEEPLILQFNYESESLGRYIDGCKANSCPFSWVRKVSTDANTTVEVHFAGEEPGKTSFLCQNSVECAALYEIFKVIAECNLSGAGGNNTSIGSKCESYKQKICLRKCVVTQKSIKKKNKKSLFKKSKRMASNAPEVSLLVMTEAQMICLEDKSKDVPLYMVPLRGLDIKDVDERDICFTSPLGIKFAFHCGTQEERQLFLDAREKAKNISDPELTSIKCYVDEIQTLYCGTFDKESEDDVAMLRRLWDASELGEDKDGSIPFQMQCNRWKDLGFQRDDPVSDLRATGMLGMHQLVYFAERFPNLFLQMALHQQQGEGGMEYPFCTAGINITFLLVDLFELAKDEGWFPSFATHPIMFHTENAFDELYCIVFRLFDQKWNQMQVGYMGFQKVIDEVRESVEELLHRQNIHMVPAIFDMLGILLEDLTAFKANATRTVSALPPISSLRPDLPTGYESEPCPAARGSDGEDEDEDSTEEGETCVSFGGVETIPDPVRETMDVLEEAKVPDDPATSESPEPETSLIEEDIPLRAKPRKRRSMSKSSQFSPIFVPDEEHDVRRETVLVRPAPEAVRTDERQSMASLPPPASATASEPILRDAAPLEEEVPGVKKRKNTKGHLASWRKKLTGSAKSDKS